MAHHPHAPLRGRATALALGAVLALVLAACGASSSGDGVVSLVDPSATPAPSAAAPSASVDPEDVMLAFERCMKEHGVDLHVVSVGDNAGGAGGTGGTIHVDSETPAPGEIQPGRGAPDPKAMQAADEACRHLLPAGGMGDPNATMDPALADQLLKFSQCMRDHGIDFPDPQFSGGGVSIQVGSGDGPAVDPTSQAFKDAQEACGRDLPGGAPFTIGGSASGTEVKP